MSSYRRILFHLVFRTKNSRKTINQKYCKELYAYIIGFTQNKDSFLYQINGIEDHLHILCDLHPGIALADFMRELKVSTSIWMKQSGKFPAFEGWADGYAGLTYSWRDKEKIINYIKNQQEHHKVRSFEDELRVLLKENGIEINELYFP
jgi:REP element-mobilizing transposase RayT